MTDSPKDDEAAAEMPRALPTSEFHGEMPTRNTHEEKHLTHLVEAAHHHERAATHHAHAAEGHLEISERHWRRHRAAQDRHAIDLKGEMEPMVQSATPQAQV